MSVSIQIVTHSPSLDMYGEPDRSSAYSLSGHVSISLNAPSSIFERRRTTSFLLKSLNLIFEGQTELLTPRIGYTSLRLCTITRDIAPSEPVELSNEGQEDTTCQWDIVFDIPIPGWLPATTLYGTEDLGTTYHLEAVAVLIPIEDSTTSSPWSFNSLCVPFRSLTKTISAAKEISLRRYIDTQFLDSTQVPDTVYLVNSRLMTSSDDGLHIPQSILSKIQVVAAVPEYMDVNSRTVALTVRMRTQGLEMEHCKRLQLTGFSMDVVQREKSRFQPSDECRRRLPIPPDSEQPPKRPLRNGYRGGFLYDGFCNGPLSKDAGHARDVSLLHQNECGEYRLAGDCHIFSNDASMENPSWYTLQTSIPVLSKAECAHDEDWELLGSPKLRATSSSPLLSFRHEVRMTLSVSYDVPGEGAASEVLSFSVPLKFAHLPPPPPVSAPIVPLVVRTNVMNMSPLPSSTPATYIESSALPAYSQLFYSNGDRKLDPTPLPLYTSRDEPRSVESTSTAPNPNPELEAVSDAKAPLPLPSVVSLAAAMDSDSDVDDDSDEPTDDYDGSTETTALL